MRIKTGEHAVDRGFDQFFIRRLLDVVGAHALEHVAEQVELAIDVRCGGVGAGADEHQARLRCQQRQGRAGRCTENNQGSLAHHPRTFSPSPAAHHGPGSTGLPPFRNST